MSSESCSLERKSVKFRASAGQHGNMPVGATQNPVICIYLIPGPTKASTSLHFVRPELALKPQLTYIKKNLITKNTSTGRNLIVARVCDLKGLFI